MFFWQILVNWPKNLIIKKNQRKMKKIDDFEKQSSPQLGIQREETFAFCVGFLGEKILA
jgi:hypothetical protein